MPNFNKGLLFDIFSLANICINISMQNLAAVGKEIYSLLLSFSFI